MVSIDVMLQFPVGSKWLPTDLVGRGVQDILADKLLATVIFCAMAVESSL
jgi:hypothetical protein